MSLSPIPLHLISTMNILVNYSPNVKQKALVLVKKMLTTGQIVSVQVLLR